MRIFETIIGSASFAIVIGLAGSAAAQEAHAAATITPEAQVLDSETPAEAFRTGYSAYQAGNTTAAVEALQFAADKGHPMAQWKLGRMYAAGDGIERDPMKAFELFSEVANAYADENPRAPSAPFVADAFVALGTYYRDGIPGSEVKPDFRRARQMFTYAASYFGDADAQLNLAHMYYEGEGGDRDPRQAVRWAKLAADKGNIAAQAMLGNLLFQGDGVQRQPVIGLMFLTVASERATSEDEQWIRNMQEEAFSLASETERRTATALASEWMLKNNLDPAPPPVAAVDVAKPAASLGPMETQAAAPQQ
jgi:TPR repeat protein